MKLKQLFPVFALAAVLAAGCGDSVSTPSGDTTLPQGMAGIRVLLTDAPSDYIASAIVTITHVYLVPGDDDTEAVDLFLAEEGIEPKTYDLFDLQNGIQALLADTPVDPGTFEQLRIRVEEPEVTLAEGYEFRDGSTTKALKVPSGSQSGIKVDLGDPIDALEGQITVVVVDFDVNENFVLQGNPETPAGINGVLFKPRLKRVVEDEVEEDGS